MSHIRQSLARSMRCWVAAGLVLATLVGAQVNAASDAEAADSSSAGFYDGLVKYSDIISCQSIIFPPTYTEKGAAAYVGGYADPESGIPAVGQTFYVHVVVYGLGNACSGQRFIPALSLPSGVTFDTVQPILCFTSNGQATGTTDCPQWGNVSASTFGPGFMYRSTDTANANAWPLPQGYFWEFRFPVKSSTIQTNANLQGSVKMFDGNDSPVLNPSAPLYVFGAGSPPAVMHDRPSTVASEFLPGTATPSAFGMVSSGQVVVNGQGGTIRYRRGTASGNYSANGSFSVPSGSSSWNIWTDWDEPGFADVQPGKKYFWQFGFDPDPAGGGTVWGQEQSFTGLWASTCQRSAITVSLGLGQLPTAGDDVILGTPGADDIQGGGGNDTICSGAGADTVNGGAGNDTVDAGGGSDLVIAGLGNDVLKGGADKDTVSYADATGAVTVSLGASGDQATGGGGTDRLSAFERLTGGDGPDRLTGNGAANRISGGKGDDQLIGGAGSDYCDGGAGTDSGKSCETKVKIP